MCLPGVWHCPRWDPKREGSGYGYVIQVSYWGYMIMCLIMQSCPPSWLLVTLEDASIRICLAFRFIYLFWYCTHNLLNFTAKSWFMELDPKCQVLVITCSAVEKLWKLAMHTAPSTPFFFQAEIKFNDYFQMNYSKE